MAIRMYTYDMVRARLGHTNGVRQLKANRYDADQVDALYWARRLQYHRDDNGWTLSAEDLAYIKRRDRVRKEG